MNYKEWAAHLLWGQNIADKLFFPEEMEFDSSDVYREVALFNSPGRNKVLAFSDSQLKFPKPAQFHLEEKRAQAIHSFANHELLAIEIFAAMLLKFPDERFARGIVKTIVDEQKHLSMYIKRLADWGVQMGDFPMNDYFWRISLRAKNMPQFFAFMSLTFESANLDFAKYYGQIFKGVEDIKSKNIMDVVFEDEVSHVRAGALILNDLKNDKTLWQYYLEQLPEGFTPARARGISYSAEHRKGCGLDDDFLLHLGAYSDDFPVTKRKNRTP